MTASPTKLTLPVNSVSQISSSTWFLSSQINQIAVLPRRMAGEEGQEVDGILNFVAA